MSFLGTRNHTVNNNHFASTNNNCTINPLDKVVELYERLVQAEKEKVEYLEKIAKGK